MNIEYEECLENMYIQGNERFQYYDIYIYIYDNELVLVLGVQSKLIFWNLFNNV